MALSFVVRYFRDWQVPNSVGRSRHIAHSSGVCNLNSWFHQSTCILALILHMAKRSDHVTLGDIDFVCELILTRHCFSLETGSVIAPVLCLVGIGTYVNVTVEIARGEHSKSQTFAWDKKSFTYAVLTRLQAASKNVWWFLIA